MMNLSYVAIGLLTGILSGFLGLGGGIIMIPLLIYICGLTQHQAQGTSLAIMVLPITLLAALRYFYSGNVRLGMALFVALGFAAGGLIGAHFVQYVPDQILKKVFGVTLFLVSVRMIFFK
jgi:hypothetical protein